MRRIILLVTMAVPRICSAINTKNSCVLWSIVNLRTSSAPRGVDPAVHAVESLASVGKVRLFGLVVAREFGRYGLPPTSTLSSSRDVASIF
jgi:hypothetical protein